MKLKSLEEVINHINKSKINNQFITPENLLICFASAGADQKELILEAIDTLNQGFEPYFTTIDSNGKNLLDYCADNLKLENIIIGYIQHHDIMKKMVLLNPGPDGKMTFERLKSTHESVTKLKENYEKFLKSPKKAKPISQLLKFCVGAASGYDISAYLYNDEESRKALYMCFRKFIRQTGEKLKQLPDELKELKMSVESHNILNTDDMEKFDNLFEKQMPFILSEAVPTTSLTELGDKKLFDEFAKFGAGELSKGNHQYIKKIDNLTTTFAKIGGSCFVSALVLSFCALAIISSFRGPSNNSNPAIQLLKFTMSTKLGKFGMVMLATSLGMKAVCKLFMMNMEKNAHKQLIEGAKKQFKAQEHGKK